MYYYRITAAIAAVAKENRVLLLNNTMKIRWQTYRHNQHIHTQSTHRIINKTHIQMYEDEHIKHTYTRCRLGTHTPTSYSTRHLSSACEIRNEQTFWNFGFEDSRKSFPKRNDDDDDVYTNSNRKQQPVSVQNIYWDFRIKGTSTLSRMIRRYTNMQEQQNDFF